MTVVVTTVADGPVTHELGDFIEPYDDGSLHVMRNPVTADAEPSIVGYHVADTWTHVRIETDAVREAAVEELAAMRPGVWLIPEEPQHGTFPSPADLRPHIDALNAVAKAMAEVYDAGNEVRQAYQLQQVAAALWFGLDPTRVGRMRFEFRHGCYEKVHYRADATMRRTQPDAKPAFKTDFAYVGTDEDIDITVTITDPHAGEALWKMVGAPLWPSVGTSPKPPSVP